MHFVCVNVCVSHREAEAAFFCLTPPAVFFISVLYVHTCWSASYLISYTFAHWTLARFSKNEYKVTAERMTPLRALWSTPAMTKLMAACEQTRETPNKNKVRGEIYSSWSPSCETQPSLSSLLFCSDGPGRYTAAAERA